MEKQEPGEERQCLGQGRWHTHDDQQMRIVDVEEGREPAGPRMGWRLPAGRWGVGSPARTLKTKRTDQQEEFAQEDDAKPPCAPNAV